MRLSVMTIEILTLNIYTFDFANETCRKPRAQFFRKRLLEVGILKLTVAAKKLRRREPQSKTHTRKKEAVTIYVTDSKGRKVKVIDDDVDTLALVQPRQRTVIIIVPPTATL